MRGYQKFLETGKRLFGKEIEQELSLADWLFEMLKIYEENGWDERAPEKYRTLKEAWLSEAAPPPEEEITEETIQEVFWGENEK